MKLNPTYLNPKRYPEHKIKFLEKEIQFQILQYLTLKNILNWRNNTGALRTERGFMRFGVPGSPDIFAVKDGKLYGIEVKRGKAKQSELQEHFGNRLLAAGALYIVARSLDDVVAIL